MTPDSPFSFLDLLKWLASALGAMALYVLGLFKKRIEASEVNHQHLLEKVRELELNTVGRDTFQRHEADTNDKLEAMRKEAIGREDRLATAIEASRKDLAERVGAVVTRVDGLYKERHER